MKSVYSYGNPLMYAAHSARVITRAPRSRARRIGTTLFQGKIAFCTKFFRLEMLDNIHCFHFNKYIYVHSGSAHKRP